MTALTTLTPAIECYLDEFIVRSRRIALLRRAGMALAVFLAWMLLWCAADRLLGLSVIVRWVLLAGGAALAAARLAPALLARSRQGDRVWAAAEIERQNPRFGQRLLTVTSRMLGAADYRGSDEILLRLVREVDEQVAVDRRARRPGLGRAVRPWAACAVLAIIIAGLVRVPGLRFGDLIVRFIDPAADVPPVTTTQLVVHPGAVDVPQSHPLTVDVEAAPLGDGLVTLYLSDAGRNWSRVAMTASGAGHFSFTLATVDHDLRYYVSGGDARSPEYLVRALRRPAVAQFRIHYEYPPYTGLPPAIATNTDGRIEAPTGTKAVLTVTATEPLQAALLTLGTEKILMDRTPDPYSRQTQLIVRSQTHYTVDLISTRDVAGSGPPGALIRALPDLPPQVRLARSGQSLHLSPRDIIPLSYEALDDYGLKSLLVRAQVNLRKTREIPVTIWGDSRRQQDVVEFDLATLPLAVGDVVTLSLFATDTAGHSAESQPLHLLISPRSINLDMLERISELSSAADLAQALTTQLDDAVQAQDQLQSKDRQSAEYLTVSSRADRALSAAAQTATLLRQSLLRAITHSRSPQLSTVLSAWVDIAEIESAAAEEAFRQSGAPAGMVNTGREKLRRAVADGRALQSQLATVTQGEQAAAVLADRQNLRAAAARPAPKDQALAARIGETLQRMRQDLQAVASQLGLNAGSDNLENQLREKIAAGDALVNAAKPIDFASAVRQWAQDIRSDARQRLGLEGRLSAAAEAQAIRPDADLILARDLEVASRAASAIVAAARGSGRPASGAMLDAFVAQIEDLDRARELERDPATHSPDEIKRARDRAVKARMELARMAGDPEALAAAASRNSTFTSGSAERQKEAEDLAMQASAAAASRDYQRAVALDQALLRRLEARSRREGPGISSPASEPEAAAPRERIEHHGLAVQREMAAARSLDDLDREQQRIAGTTAWASDALADRQQGVAERIALVQRQRAPDTSPDVISSSTREKATAEILSAQEQLAGMAQALAAAQTAAAARREAARSAADARRSAQSAPPDQKAAADRAATRAQQNADEAAARLTRASDPVAPSVARATAERLSAFGPDTDSAREAIEGELSAALSSLHEALPGDDAMAVDRAAADSRQAVEICQRELAAVQDALVSHDPLVAAKWFARAAAQSLTLRPPDVAQARHHQASVSAALSRAWDQSIHRAAAERLAALPSMAAILGPPSPVAGGAAVATQTSSKFPAAREWSRLRPQDADTLAPAVHANDPPGYEESLKLYFEGLGNAREGK